MVYMDKHYLKNNHDEDVVEKCCSENMKRTLWRNVVAKIILNINIGSVLSFSQNPYLARQLSVFRPAALTPTSE
jgi:hypothetical protein